MGALLLLDKGTDRCSRKGSGAGKDAMMALAWSGTTLVTQHPRGTACAAMWQGAGA